LFLTVYFIPDVFLFLQSAAIHAIDEILHKRGHLSLIAGQPLHPIPKGAPVPNTVLGLKQRKAGGSVNTNGTVLTSQNQGKSYYRSRPSLSLGESSKTATLSASSQSQPQAGSSSSIKKSKVSSARQTQSQLCVLCGNPPHFMKDCPIVRAGSKRFVVSK